MQTHEEYPEVSQTCHSAVAGFKNTSGRSTAYALASRFLASRAGWRSKKTKEVPRSHGSIHILPVKTRLTQLDGYKLILNRFAVIEGCDFPVNMCLHSLDRWWLVLQCMHTYRYIYIYICIIYIYIYIYVCVLIYIQLICCLTHYPVRVTPSADSPWP